MLVAPPSLLIGLFSGPPQQSAQMTKQSAWNVRSIFVQISHGGSWHIPVYTFGTFRSTTRLLAQDLIVVRQNPAAIVHTGDVIFDISLVLGVD